MSFGKPAASIGAFYALLKEIALFISNKKPIKAGSLSHLYKPKIPSPVSVYFLSDIICHLSNNGCIVLQTSWKFEDAV